MRIQILILVFKRLKVTCPARKSTYPELPDGLFSSPVTHKWHIHFNWNQVLISASMILQPFWRPTIVVWPGFAPSITFPLSYILLFHSQKLGACLGQVYKIINPLQGSRIKKNLSSNKVLYKSYNIRTCYTQETGPFFKDYDVLDSNNLTLTLVPLSLWTFALSTHESSPPFSLFPPPVAEQCCF